MFTQAIKFYTFHYLLRKKCPYSELLWSVFSRIRTEYGEIIRISLYSVRMRENTDQNNSEYRHVYAVITFEYRCLKNVIHQIHSKYEWLLLSASFTEKFELIFVLTLENAFS